MVAVAVLGAAGGIGQPISLLLKLNTEITKLHLYDIVRCPGVGADVSHINTDSEVKTFQGATQLKECLEGMQIVVIPAGVPRKPGMTRDDLFNINAGIVRDLVQAVAEACPKAFVCIISNPVNSTVPIAAEVLKKNGVYDPRRVFGVTTLDVVRSSRFIRDIRPEFSCSRSVTVIGGHSGNTIIPILSSLAAELNLSTEEVDALTHRIQFGGDEVVKAKNGEGSATLSMAYAGSRFVSSLIAAVKGRPASECSYIDLDAHPSAAESAAHIGVTGLSHFSLPVALGPDGVDGIAPHDKPGAREAELIKEAVVAIKSNIAAGTAFVLNK
ncbi:putative malate dehydrogenase, mitochondrial [Zancudomyces culisetae]|uniref:Malate dehydrogenase n=1 Tax=Zancudomyces culisetae TaxID=1213189 RepID=A0A1R1PYC3_ZANCU|nr:putative malate dehydrogenase, mitochondrial [Zancudomyces culisetae]|eukprot:OMH85929.1 putative malate dehydrogenase, mitochondrial [Zancudomyces culisetae]